MLDHSQVLGKVGEVAYKLELPEELSRVHNTFHVSNLKKCYADEPLAVPLDGLHFDDKLQFVEEPVEIVDREVKRLKRSRIPLVKVRWNSKRGHEFTWEREDQIQKIPTPRSPDRPSSSAASSFVKLCVKLFVGIFWKAKQSDQLEWICGMLHGLVINWSSSAIETSRNRVNGEYRDDKKDVRKSG
ncbi:putative reverse transcriptase domain-containing protein [Tanacetum coccineum]